MIRDIPFIQDKNDVEHVAGITNAFPYTMHERDLTNEIIPWHWHEEVEFDYAYKGTIQINTLSDNYVVHQGEAYFINTNVMTQKQKNPDSSITIEHAHIFHPVLLSGYFRSIFQTKYLDPILNNHGIEVLIISRDSPSGKKLIDILERLDDLTNKTNTEFLIRNLLSDAWLALMNEVKTQKQFISVNPRDRAKEIMSYLHLHYSEKLSLEKIAKEVNISVKECNRCFRKVFHQAPIEYLLNYRIEQAKILLRNSSESVTEVALHCGFNNSAYFSKMFKRFTKQTPLQYRKANFK